MLRSTFLVFFIHLGPRSLNKDWHVYKIYRKDFHAIIGNPMLNNA